MQNTKHKNKRKSNFFRMSALTIIITIGFCIFAGSVAIALSLYNDEDFFQSLNTRTTGSGRATWGIFGSNRTYNSPLVNEPYIQATNRLELVTQYIYWPFTAFAEPDFTAVTLGHFQPQQISSYYVQNGWAFVATENGNGWVYTAADMVYTQKTIGLFEQIDGEIVSWLHPQIVQVIERQGNWLGIDISGELKWINFYFQPPIYKLEEFMKQFGNTVSVFYENLASGFTFSHNGNQVYFGASATKAPFALYIYLKTEREEASMTDIHTFTANDQWAGSGVIRHRYNIGATFTQRQLLYLMLAPSDNIATRILRRVHGIDGHTEFVGSIGANPNHVRNITYSYLTANDAGIFTREFYRYIMSGGRYSQEFKDNLLANRYQFVISDYPVGSKSGWSSSFGGGWHDMAIVFAPSPYTLSILSARAGTYADRRAYDSISMFVQEFNSRWFYPGTGY